MGKNLIQQRRGRGTPRYRSPGHRFVADVVHPEPGKMVRGVVADIVNDPGRDAPLVLIEMEDGRKIYEIAWDGAYTGQRIEINSDNPSVGNLVELRNIPEGTSIFNIEFYPGDGGKAVRTAGSSAVVVSKAETKCVVQLPSKKKKELQLSCRAMIGKVAADGINEKPLMKAGNKWKKMKARNKLYPIVTGRSMNAVDHPFGGSNLGRKKTVSRNAPPGAKVGSIAARRTGKRK